MAKKNCLLIPRNSMENQPIFEKSMANSLEIHEFRGKTKESMAYLQTGSLGLT